MNKNKKYTVAITDLWTVEADSADKAIALYFVANGFDNSSDYPEVTITTEDIKSVEFLEQLITAHEE